MPELVYQRRKYTVWPDGEGMFVVHNGDRPFKKNHTHARDKGEAKKLINAAIHEKIPKDTDFRFLKSLIRISKGDFHKEKIKELIAVRKDKGPKEKYVNRPHRYA